MNNGLLRLAPVLVCTLAGLHQKEALAATTTAAPASIYITHATVIDMESGAELSNQTVVVSGELILSVRPDQAGEPPSGAQVINAQGKYVIPGLWDMHVHGTNGEQSASLLPLYVANGVTGVREMFGPPDANKFRTELAALKIDAPKVYLGSPIVDGKPPFWPNAVGVDSAAEARAFVVEQKQKGADFIKVYDGLTKESYFAIIEEARKQQIPVAGHVPLRVTAWEATASRQQAMEHLQGILVACSTREKALRPKMLKVGDSREKEMELFRDIRESYNAEKCQRLFATFKANRTWQVPTLTPFHADGLRADPAFRNDPRLRYFSGEIREWLSASSKEDPMAQNWTATDAANSKEMYESRKMLVRAMYRAGVPILAGSDAGNAFAFPGFGLHDELALLVEAGMTPLNALQTATWNAAVFMLAHEKYGSVSPGKVADLVLLDANPLDDIHNTTKIAAVVLSGKVLDRAALDQILKTAEQAASAAAAN